jgi:rod shape-determining protein MreC
VKSLKKDQNFSNLLPVLFIVLGIFLISLNNINALEWVKNPISYIFEPITFKARTFGQSINEYTELFLDLGNFKKEYNDMKIELAKKETSLAEVSILREDIKALREQINLGNLDNTYVEATVMSDSTLENLIINKGEKEGIQVGDIVTLGNMYVGIVSEVSMKGSKIRLPSSKSNHLEVIITSSQSHMNEKVLSKAVVSGSPEGILIENIEMNAEVINGDVVVINDTRVGELLVLGYVVGLSEDPASISKTAYVSQIIEAEDLINVFVRID